MIRKGIDLFHRMIFIPHPPTKLKPQIKHRMCSGNTGLHDALPHDRPMKGPN